MKPPFHWDHIDEGAYLRFNYRGIGSVVPDPEGGWRYTVTWQGLVESGVEGTRDAAIAWVEAWAARQRGLPVMPERKSTKGRWRWQ